MLSYQHRNLHPIVSCQMRTATTKSILTSVLLLSGAAGIETAQAGGIILYEIATPDIGLASAGYASRAADASTVFKNPAGMSALEGAQFQGGLQALYGSVSFSRDTETSARLGLDDGGNAVGWLPGASGFIVIPAAEKLRLGFGALSYFGLAEDYHDDWVGRYYVQKGVLLGLSLTPSVSLEVTDWLALGAGLNAMYGLFDTDVAVNNLAGPDGQMSVKDEAWGFGANVGVLIRAGERTRIGLSYLSSLDLDFNDRPSFSGLGPGFGAILANPSALDLGMTVPQGAMASVYHQLSDRLAVMADFGWQDWSEFGKVDVGIETGGTVTRTLNANYQDTWHGALGLQYRASENLLLSAGAAFDSSAVENENRTVTLPMGQTWRFGLGVQYQVSRSVDLGLSETFMWAGDMPVDQGDALSLRGRVSGLYPDAWFSITSLNLNWRF